jgi:hypothetical protein
MNRLEELVGKRGQEARPEGLQWGEKNGERKRR